MVGKNIEECTDQVEVVTSDVGHLENWANSSRDKLSGSIHTLLPVLNENGDFACARRFENLSQLCDSLLENLWGTDINFSDDNHDWNIERKGDTEMLPNDYQLYSYPRSRLKYLLAHTNQTVIRSHHQEAVVRLTR